MKKLDYAEGPKTEVFEVKMQENVLNIASPYDILYSVEPGEAGAGDSIRDGGSY